jgi:hypothetical protein
MIDTFIYLAQGLRLVDFEDASHLYLLDQDNRMVNYLDREMISTLFACEYLEVENKENSDGRKFKEYKLSKKSKALYDAREGRPVHASEHFWIIKYKRDVKLNVFIDISTAAPNLSTLIEEDWGSGHDKSWIPIHRIVITCYPPNYVYGNDLLKDIA